MKPNLARVMLPRIGSVWWWLGTVGVAAGEVRVLWHDPVCGTHLTRVERVGGCDRFWVRPRDLRSPRP